MRKPRHLSADERALWDRVAERTKPLDPAAPKLASPRPAEPKKPKAKSAIAPFQVSGAARPVSQHDVLPGIADRLKQAPVHMDHKSFRNMKRGKLKPEARIDLHGMTLAEAHPALTDFILMSQATGRRLVLVITGKGKARDDGGPIPTRLGVLRHQVPQWLAMPPLAGAILQVTPAHLRHGGDGAYYVYLSRHR